MPAVLNQTPFLLTRPGSPPAGRGGRGPRTAESEPGPGKRFSRWLRSLPRSWHLVPYGALFVLGAALLWPGVVPHGPDCGGVLAVASVGERELFIRWSAWAFGLVAGLLLLSALAASAQRRGDRPGAPTIAGASLFGALTVAAMAWPHAPYAAPVQAVMSVEVLAVLVSGGTALLVPILASGLAWWKLRGPRRLRGAQIAAWTTLLIALPLVMAATYIIVTPICLD